MIVTSWLHPFFRVKGFVNLIDEIALADIHNLGIRVMVMHAFPFLFNIHEPSAQNIEKPHWLLYREFITLSFDSVEANWFISRATWLTKMDEDGWQIKFKNSVD